MADEDLVACAAADGGERFDADEAAAATAAPIAPAAASTYVEVPDTRPFGTRKPLEIQYCPNCSYPPEYCEFSGKLQGCIPFLKKTLYKGKDISALEHRGKGKEVPVGPTPEEIAAAAASTGETTKITVNVGGKTKARDLEVHVQAVERRPRRYTTSVTGLHLFGKTLSDACKTFKKQFASGATVVKDASNVERIDIQGDVAEALALYITKKMAIPWNVVFITAVEGKKERAFKKDPALGEDSDDEEDDDDDDDDDDSDDE